MHKLRCPKPEEFQDCVYWALLARLDQEKSKRKIKVGIKKKPKLKRQVIDYTNKTKTICDVCSKMVWPHHLKVRKFQKGNRGDFNNKFLRERGMASNPKMEYQVFLCIFQKNSAMDTVVIT